VNFTQRECVEQAQNMMSVNFCTRDEKKAIENAYLGFRFDSPFGKDIKRYISHGVGLHHAGLLPKYRLLVEKLTQSGMMKVIMGTDTLGVGINVPIRTVLFTKLCKFDGKKVSILSARDFKQIAGRAGRKGFDQAGSVVCQAPEHVIENRRIEARFAADAKKKKVQKKEAPTKNYVHWDEKTFQRLIEQREETLPSQFTVSHGMIVTLLLGAAPNFNLGYRRLINLIARCHETISSKRKLRRRSALLFKSLIHAGVVIKEKRKGIRINPKLDKDFSLNHALSLYLLHALELLDPNDPEYALNVLTLVESITENPRTILQKQVDYLKTQKMAEMRMEGLEYEQRMEELEKIEHPKPLRDFIYDTFNAFSEHHPWVEQENIQPKSIAREMVEQASSFNGYVKDYGLERSEGVLLRHLSQVYKILVQTVPEQYKTQEVWDIQVGLRTMLGRVDSSLVDEWEKLFKAPTEKEAAIVAKPALFYEPDLNPKPFLARVRSDLFALVSALQKGTWDDVAAIICQDEKDVWTEERLQKAVDPYFAEHERIIIDPRARAGHLTHIEKVDDNTWKARQILLDPEENNDWFIEAEIRLDTSIGPESPILTLLAIGK